MTARPRPDHQPVLAPSALEALPRSTMLHDVVAGLSRPAKLLPCKYFYDARGSALFERICELPEYYLTRTEFAIMERDARAMAQALGPRVRLVEFGSGNSSKTRLLLDALEAPTSYLPVDIARDQLESAVRGLRRSHPSVPVEPLCADYTQPIGLPPSLNGTTRTVCYFPGSTVGNFSRTEAVAFLARVAALAGKGGVLLIGADLVKDTAVLLPAYNDTAEVTADFNLNLLLRVNAELGADFSLGGFRHRAIWNGLDGRIEMQLVSQRSQVVKIGGRQFRFRKGEVLTTEYSHKYRLPDFAAMAAEAGFAVEQVWTDDRQWFSVQLLRAR